jgi:hypothetical protein
MNLKIALVALLLCPTAFADRILAPGEMYTAQFAGERVACDTGNSQPNYYDFAVRERVDHADAWQGRDESNARSMCEGDGQAQVFFADTVQKLIRNATAQCLRSYPNCKQLGQTQGDFVSKAVNYGKYACFLRVTVRGTK